MPSYNFVNVSQATKIEDYKNYWKEIVTLDYEDFKNEPGDLRRAFHSAISLFHMSDWLYQNFSGSINASHTYIDKNNQSQIVTDENNYPNAIAALHPDFELIRGIANSAKHLKLRAASVAASVARNPSAPSNAANTYLEMSPQRERGEIMLEGPGGVDISVLHLATSVYGFWQNYCQNRGWPLA